MKVNEMRQQYPATSTTQSIPIGVITSDDLKWGVPVTQIPHKTLYDETDTAQMIAWNKHNYIGHIRLLYEYSSIVWDPYYTKDIHAQQRTQQEQAAMFISGDFTSI